MKYKDLINKCHQFCKLANKIDHVSQLQIDHSGMRPESLNIVKKQRSNNVKMRPIEIEIYPNSKPFLADGRHRLQIAKELNDKSISAIIRYYDEDGNVIDRQNTIISL